jgi:NADH dehydrogenase
MILVVGATGDLGTAICRRLRDRGLSVRGLVRATSDPARVSYLDNLGVKTVQGNLKDRTTLDAACKGAETVITTATITLSQQPDDTIQQVDQAGQINLVEAAQTAAVRHFIYISYSRNLNTDSPLTTAKRTVEQYLIHSGMAYTILRSSFFMEVWLSPAVGFDYANAKATVYGSGANKISWISRGDVASFAVAALAASAAHNAILELGGPEALSPLAVVHIFEQATGEVFEVQHVPEETLRTQRAQTTDSVQQSLSALMLDYAKGDVIDMQPVLPVFPIHLLSVVNYTQHVLVNR